ncbi:MAG: elongation factor Ts [Ignavibacteria bacterium]|nr:elongation factor Ts [Ignavibacteria bacterium]
MAISAQQVKDLREKTGAGMMDCKGALNEANGAFEKAIEILRKKGTSVAAKRAERTANEGKVLTQIINDNTGFIIEVNCETDFVAKSNDFLSFSDLALKGLIEKRPSSVEELLNLSIDGKKIADELTNIVGKIGEKIEISRFKIEESKSGVIVDYVHHGSKLGVLVVTEDVAETQKEELKALLKDVAMQIAAMKPFFVRREEVPADVIAKEIEIYKELAKKEGKPEQMLDKIAQGRLGKYYQESCLVDQLFIKDNSKSVQELIDESNKKWSSKARIVSFDRFHLSDEKK